MPYFPTGAADSLEVLPENTRRRGPGGALVNLGGWLLFGTVSALGPFFEAPWEVFLALQPPYPLIGFVLSLLLGAAYDRLAVGPRSFRRSLMIIVPASYLAGVVWFFINYNYQVFGAPVVHSMLTGAPSPFNVPRGVPIFSRAIGSAIAMFGWSVLRLGLQYNLALRDQREEALRATAAARDARLRMLAYQLNPHFLFNTLNSIRALINEDGQRARDMVTALAGYLRYALVDRPLHVARLDEEVASVRGYLAIEKVRFEERLDARLEIDPATLSCKVPAFLLNPLVENAVKHGAAGTADAPLVLRVDARLVAPDRLRLTVENTGVWRDRRMAAREDGLPGGVGLANVHARLAALHPGDHRIDIDEGDGYVRVVVELPARFCSEDAT